LPGGKIVPPRYARIFIYGSSDDIANTFMSRLILPTPDLDGAEEQIYTSLANQDVSVFYNLTEFQEVYVKIYVPVDASLSDSQLAMIKDKVLYLNTHVTIGQLISEKLIDEQFIEFVEVDIIGSAVSDEDANYKNYFTIDADKIPQFSADRITIEAVT
jgi:hypothetical protein